MLKRLTWFTTGAIAGVAGAGFAKRKVKQTAAQLAPSNIAKVAAAKVREKGHDVAEAVRDGRDAMRAKEAELRAKLDSDAARAGGIEGLDGLDGVDPLSGDPRLAPGRVIVIDEPEPDEHSDEHGDERRGPRRHSRRHPRRG